MADGIVRKQKNTVLTIMISTVFFDYSGVEVELPHSALDFPYLFCLFKQPFGSVFNLFFIPFRLL